MNTAASRSLWGDGPRGFGVYVSAIVPAAFEVHARVFHPACDRDTALPE
ncbi:hypothetical protein [Thermobaculum terrenum]|nr:hypothetical protein [Thermobaculum terrenum]